MPDIKSGSGPAFLEAIEFLVERLQMDEDRFIKLAREVDLAATDRSAGMSDALVADLLAEVLKAMEDGTTMEQFRASFDLLIKTHGWTGDNTFGWRSALTFRAMTAQAMAAGRWRQIERLKENRPYLRYVTAGDHRVRDAHRAWHNIILPIDHPWWRTHFPPNGFNCRCHVQQLSERDLLRYKLKVSEAAPPLNPVIKFVKDKNGLSVPVEVPAGIDPGFAFNAGEIGLGMHHHAA
jgi:SPP1 gp7 family putative phage head morphogenesis protein